jgi:hypothetical protein
MTERPSQADQERMAHVQLSSALEERMDSRLDAPVEAEEPTTRTSPSQ